MAFMKALDASRSPSRQTPVPRHRQPGRVSGRRDAAAPARGIRGRGGRPISSRRGGWHATRPRATR
jgi:hypothetical protein